MLRVIVSCPQIIQSAFCICILAVVSEWVICSLVLNTNVFKTPPFIFHFCHVSFYVVFYHTFPPFSIFSFRFLKKRRGRSLFFLKFALSFLTSLCIPSAITLPTLPLLPMLPILLLAAQGSGLLPSAPLYPILFLLHSSTSDGSL